MNHSRHNTLKKKKQIGGEHIIKENKYYNKKFRNNLLNWDV